MDGQKLTGKFTLHELKSTDLLVELFPSMGVLECQIESSLHDPVIVSSDSLGVLEGGRIGLP